MVKKTSSSGWILCPSKTYPGKFYYFNVHNGEAEWSLNDNVKKGLKNKVTIQKVKKKYLYPEPVTPPDHQSPRISNYYSTTRTFFSSFGQSKFPKYFPHFKENPSVIWTSNAMPQLMTNRKTKNQTTQTEQDNMNGHTCSILLSKRFQNNINKTFGSINYFKTQTNNWWNSTNIWSNIGKETISKTQYKRKLDTKPFIKESKLRCVEHTNKKDMIRAANPESTQYYCDKVENLKSIPNQSTDNLDVNDLRYVLKAKRRESVELRNVFNKEHSTFNNTKKVTFNMGDDNSFYCEKKNIDDEIIYTYDENQKASPWYIVVDLATLLEDYNYIKHYFDKDENCHLYIPSVVENELKDLCMGEHGGRRRVIVARQLLRQLGTDMHRLNLPQNKEDTTINQIINCCLEIIKRNYEVVVITKDFELLHTAKYHKIRVYHINDIKSNDLEYNVIDPFKQNIFLQNKCDFDPFIISKAVRATEYYYATNISGHKGLNKYNNFTDITVSEIKESNLDISDMILSFNKLKVNDNILNIERRIKNNLFESNNNINCNFHTLFHINDEVPKNGNYCTRNKISKEDNINITFSNRGNLEAYTNIKPLNTYFKATDNIFEDMLTEFHIKDSIMEHNIYGRFDEWICSYEQIMEEFLYIVLQGNIQQVNHQPPWFLHEGMKCLKEIYRDNNYIIHIIEKLLYYYDFSTEKGTNIKPYNFMKLFGCGFCLVEALEKSSPLHISDIKKKLILLRNILEQSVEDLLLDSPRRYNIEDGHMYRYKFVKNPSYVLDYLKDNFIEWKNYNEDNSQIIEQAIHKDNIKVVRTVGKNLNKLTINKSNCLSFIKETDKQTHTRNSQPFVIRNIKLDTSEKLKKDNNTLNPDTESISNITKYERNEKKVNDTVLEDNDMEVVSLNNISINDNNDSTKDSGFGSNSLHAYSMVRNFLSELSSSFKTIHTFIDESTKKYNENIDEENKKILCEKANKTHSSVVDIIEKLKIIIQRESMESSTLKSLLIKSGSDDKRTTRYRPVVMKCLEQAKILENSLKLLLAIINEDEVSVSSENINFINIYE